MPDPTRLRLVAHPAPAPASRLVLGDGGAGGAPLPRRPERADAWLAGPEPACAQTLAALGGDGAAVESGLADLDLGSWTGRPLAEVADADPAGLHAWLSDPDARPHGGETLAELVGRVGNVLGRVRSGRNVWVVAPLVARAVTVAALAAPPALVLALEVAHAGRVQLVRGPAGWRLQALERSRRG